MEEASEDQSDALFIPQPTWCLQYSSEAAGDTDGYIYQFTVKPFG